MDVKMGRKVIEKSNRKGVLKIKLGKSGRKTFVRQQRDSVPLVLDAVHGTHVNQKSKVKSK